MKHLFFVITSIFLSCHSFAEGGAYDPMPGANRIEREVYWAWKVLPDFLLACANSPECGMDVEQQDLLRKMVANKYGMETLEIVSAKLHPELFKSATNEAHRLATTGSDPSSSIYINSDLYSNDGKSYGIPFWMGLLTHELVHHQGIIDDSRRLPDQIGGLVTRAAQKLLIAIPIPEDKNEVTVYVLNAPTPQNSRTANDFPLGSGFKVLKIDADLALDDVAVRTLNDLKPVCSSAKLMYTRVSPESVVVQPNPKVASKLTASITFTAELICFDKPRWKAFREKIGYKQIFDLNSVAGKMRTDLYGTSGWGPMFGGDGEVPFNTGELLEMKAPTSVAAGTELVIEATVRHHLKLAPVGCSLFLTSSKWVQVNSPTTPILTPDSCDLTKISEDTFQIRVRRQILSTSQPMQLELLHFCLTVPNTDADCMVTAPSKKTVIQVTNDQQISPIQVDSVELRGRRLRIVVRNAIGFESLNLATEAFAPNGQSYSLNIPLMTNQKEAIKNVLISQRDLDVVYECDLSLPAIGSIQFVKLIFESISVVSKDLKYGFFDVSAKNLVLQ